MAEESFQDKSLEPSQRRKAQAKEKGQVPRSRDLNTAIIMLGSAIMLVFLGKLLLQALMGNIQTAFQLAAHPGEHLDGINSLGKQLATKTMLVILPFLGTTFLLGFIGPALISGIHLAPKGFGFKMERISLLKGIKRIFSVHSLMEVLKSIAKFMVILSVATLILYGLLPKLLSLGHLPLEIGINQSAKSLSFAVILLSASLWLFAAIDVPFQMWENKRKLRMSHQELKDEMKETEGSPENKQNIKRKQQHLSRQRMLIELPKATIVITNPTHYAVALKYDEENGGAPELVGKGVDWMAEHIRQIAKVNNIPILSAPPLARAIYYNTELFQEIPGGLYQSVAKVLAYVYQLKAYEAGSAPQPLAPDEQALPIPDGLKREAHG